MQWKNTLETWMLFTQFSHHKDISRLHVTVETLWDVRHWNHFGNLWEWFGVDQTWWSKKPRTSTVPTNLSEHLQVVSSCFRYSSTNNCTNNYFIQLLGVRAWFDSDFEFKLLALKWIWFCDPLFNNLLKRNNKNIRDHIDLQTQLGKYSWNLRETCTCLDESK